MKKSSLLVIELFVLFDLDLFYFVFKPMFNDIFYDCNGAGQVPVLEDSEEIRFQLLSLLIDVLLPQCELPTLKTTVDALHRV